MLLVSGNLQEVVCNYLILLLMFCMSRGGLISCFWFHQRWVVVTNCPMSGPACPILAQKVVRTKSIHFQLVKFLNTTHCTLKQGSREGGPDSNFNSGPSLLQFTGISWNKSNFPSTAHGIRDKYQLMVLC